MRSCFVVSLDILKIHKSVSVGSRSGGAYVTGPYVISSVSDVFCRVSMSPLFMYHWDLYMRPNQLWYLL